MLSALVHLVAALWSFFVHKVWFGAIEAYPFNTWEESHGWVVVAPEKKERSRKVQSNFDWGGGLTKFFR